METEIINPTLRDRLNRVRTLDLNDSDQLEELMKPQLMDLEKKEIHTGPYTERLRTYLDRNQFPNKFLFGYFDDSHKLNSIMSLYFWSSMPFATLGYMFVRKNKTLFNANKNGLNLCLHKCFETGEARGITTFFSLQNSKSFYHKKRTWRKEDTFLTNKYYSIPQLEIKVGQWPEYTTIQDLMDHQTWPYDTTLWMTLLKPQYQKKLNWGKDTTIQSKVSNLETPIQIHAEVD